MTDELPETPATDAEVAAAIEAVTAPADTAESMPETNGATPPTVRIALPFTVNASHAIDAMPVGTLVTKTTPTAMTVDHPQTGVTEHPVVPSDVLHLLPIGAQVRVLDAPSAPTGKQVAITLRATETEGLFTVIAQDVHTTMAKVWHWLRAHD